MYRCHGLVCATKNQGCRYLNLMPVVFLTEGGSGYIRDPCANWWTELNGGSVVPERSKCNAVKEEGSSDPFGDCWIEQSDTPKVHRGHRRVEG